MHHTFSTSSKPMYRCRNIPTVWSTPTPPFSDRLFCSRRISPDFCFASPDRALDPRRRTALCLTSSGGDNFPRFSCKTSFWPVLVFHTRIHIRWMSSLWVAPHSQIAVAQRRCINKPTSCCEQAASNPRHLLFAAASTWFLIAQRLQLEFHTFLTICSSFYFGLAVLILHSDIPFFLSFFHL